MHPSARRSARRPTRGPRRARLRGGVEAASPASAFRCLAAPSSQGADAVAPHPRLAAPTKPLLVAKRFDWVEPRCPDGGEHAEEDADARRKAESNRERPPRERNREAGREVDRHANRTAAQDP